MRKSAFLSLAVALLAASLAWADRGYIPIPDPDHDPNEWEDGQPRFFKSLKIQEPSQRATIAWNGEEEILLLSTDLKASHRVRLLEIMPFPNEPTVTEGDPETFAKGLQLMGKGKRLLTSKGDGGVVTQEVTIGAHHISVTQVRDENAFVDWIENYLEEKTGNTGKLRISLTTREVINQYIEDGYLWFAFDLVDARQELGTHNAIQYRFRTEYLWYPLRISRSGGSGESHVQLQILTPGLLSKFRGLSHDEIQTSTRYQPVTLDPDEQQELNADMAELLGGQPATLRMWELRGQLNAFKGDLQAR